MSTKVLAILNRWAQLAQTALWPGVCVVCQKASRSRTDLCAGCAQALQRVDNPCDGCGLPLPIGANTNARCGACITGARPIVRTLSPLSWTPPTSTLIASYKYHGRLHHGLVLGAVMADLIAEHYGATPLPQLLLPVPLHPRRLKQRGYNQAVLLAQQWGSALKIPVAADVAQRIRDTPAQQGFNAAQRKQNLVGAFSISNAQPLSTFTRIAIVDDVLTTMTTVNTLARTLQLAAPQPLELHAWALARA